MINSKQVAVFLEPYIEDTGSFIDELMPMFKTRHLKAGEIILPIGAICKNAAIVVNGVTRNFFYKEDKEITSWFDFEGSFAGSLYSFYSQTPSIEGIESIVDSLLLELSFENFTLLTQKHPAFKQFRENVTNAFIANLEERGRIFQSCGAEERYEKFVKEHPNSIQKIPLKYIASFLGITPETLSRIKSKTY
jgi:CRP/FNR family transcriptional regulator, anaerobic regulatory protein